VGARFADRFEPSTGSVEIEVVSAPPEAQKERVGAVYLYQKVAGVWLERQKLLAADSRPGDQFGSALALSGGNLAVAAAGFRRNGESREGGVYLYLERDGAWIQQAFWTGCGGPARDRFGRSLALDGARLAVGAAGSACVFTAEPGAWHPEQELRPVAAGGQDDRFGESVALAGDALAVGAPGRNLGGLPASGAVDLFRFRFPQQAWFLARTLREPGGGAAYDQFGAAVAASNDHVAGVERIAVGAAGAAVGGQRSGAAYVFVRSAVGWTALPQIAVQAGQEGDRFGAALALDTHLLAVGAPAVPLLQTLRQPISPPRPGAVFVYSVGANGVSPLASLSPLDVTFGLFGAAVATRDGTVVAGAPAASSEGAAAGAAQAFLCTPARCVPENDLAPTLVLPGSRGKS